MSLTLSRKVLLLVTVPIIFMVMFVGVLACLLKQAEDAIWYERHNKDIVNECNDLLKNIADAGLMLYLYKSTKQPVFLQKFDDFTARAPEHIRSLKLMMSDSPEQLKSLGDLENATGNAVETLQEVRVSHEFSKMKGLLGDQGKFTSTAVGAVKHLTDVVKERQNSKSRGVAEEAARWHVMQWLVAGIGLNMALAVFLAMVFNRSTTKKLLVLVENTDRLATHKPLLPALEGNDEIATLDHVFHGMAKSLEEAALRKKEMISVVSHDLRTPLTSIRLSLELLSQGGAGELPAKATKLATQAERSTERLINLINDFLDLEKLEAGNLEIHPKPFVVEDLFDRAQEAVSMMAKQKNVSIVIEETPIEMSADPDRLIQVIINLLSNAVKFSPEGSTITLASSETDSQIELKVIDQGRGIPKEYLSRIFERYQQVAEEDSARGRGTGLGLYICKSFVEAHGGTIGVDSEVGKGSTFWMRFPKSTQVGNPSHEQ